MTPEEFWKIWQTPDPPVNVFYRLYYGDHGEPLFYTMEDLPGNYIEIDQQTFSLSPRNVRVKNNKLEYIAQTLTSKLAVSITGTPCHVRDVCVITDQAPNTKWSLVTYESN